ncbi:putative disease resistance protein At3g14460 [Corylus avellana]|uniref:putative disease resistance protein At3g14460 n=1 Tax=Corylus avellana TaxID=13451 RepID=UPI00286BD0FD|nr:putative disease resistance protein At3g14460 [Corylus avellana]
MASRKFVDLFWERELNEGLLMRLQMTSLSVNSVVADAEDKQFTNPAVKVWLDELKEAVYDAEDILDEIATEDLVRKQDAVDDAGDISEENATEDLLMLRKLEAELGAIASKVRNPISTSFVDKVEGEIERLLDRLNILVKVKENIGLREVNEGNSLERLPTTSVIDESRTFGRHDDKDAIINLLLSNGASSDEMGVIAIVGMGGIGKTTLAQFVFNEERVKKHFDLKAWVCVSDDFDVLKLTKTILEELGSSANDDSKNLNQLQNKLEEKMTRKKFLLVLDDVWEKHYAKWEVLSNALKFRAQGSKVITLNVSYCCHLAALPRDTQKLINLRHLDITKTWQMEEMPRHLGRIKNLRTLTEFSVGKDSGCGTGELKKLNLLRGSLSIKNLQNVTDAKDLNIRMPRQFPDWVGHPSFSNITSLRLSNCLECCSLPPLGQLPSLEKLELQCCQEVESFTEGGLASNLNEIFIAFCDKLFANRMGWGLQKLQCLRRVTIKDEANDVESFPNGGLLPISLTHLEIGGFQKLKSLDKKGLQYLTTLEELAIHICPKLECMPEAGLPASLSTLRIDECHLLEKEWERKEGAEWPKIAHVPNKYTDYNRRIGCLC